MYSITKNRPFLKILFFRLKINRQNCKIYKQRLCSYLIFCLIFVSLFLLCKIFLFKFIFIIVITSKILVYLLMQILAEPFYSIATMFLKLYFLKILIIFQLSFLFYIELNILINCLL